MQSYIRFLIIAVTSFLLGGPGPAQALELRQVKEFCANLLTKNKPTHQITGELIPISDKYFEAHLKSKIEKNGKGAWQTNRGLNHLAANFAEPFTKILSELGPQDHVIDMGSGDGEVGIDMMLMQRVHYNDIHIQRRGSYIDRDGYWVDESLSNTPSQAVLTDMQWFASRPIEERPSFTGISYVMPLKDRVSTYGGKLKFITGVFFEELDVTNIPKASLIVDNLGIASYTFDIGKVLSKYFYLLKRDASVFFYSEMDDVRIYTGRENWIPLAEFLKRIPGLEVNVYEGGYAGRKVLMVTKRADNIELPTLKLLPKKPIYANPEPRYFVIER